MSTQISFDLPTEDATQAFAQRLARVLISPLVLTFRGDLGAGKTTLIRAMLRALQVTGAIKSPTFSLVESYVLPASQSTLHHFDLYRIEDETELEYIGFRDYFTADALCCIEWPERATHTLHACDVDFAIHYQGTGRALVTSAHSPTGVALLSRLSEVS